jgi:rod shape-determining protein MreC
LKIFNFFLDIRDAIVLALCILFSLILLLTSTVNTQWPFYRLFLDEIGKLGAKVYQLNSYYNFREENQKLRQLNARLSFDNMQLQDALLENLRLRALLAFKEKTLYNLIPAEVVGQNPQSIFNGLLLDEGSSRGLAPDDPVLTADGLVGKIVIVDENSSISQILLDRNSRVSAKIQRNRELGIIAWDGGVHLKLLYLAKTIEVLIGDVILTSGYGHIFPANIKIGLVSQVSKDEEGLFQEITVLPSVNFNRLEEIFIVKQDSLHGKRQKD